MRIKVNGKRRQTAALPEFNNLRATVGLQGCNGFLFVSSRENVISVRHCGV
nr:hypothetical protein [Okeania sp. KiyG1]